MGEKDQLLTLKESLMAQVTLKLGIGILQVF